MTVFTTLAQIDLRTSIKLNNRGQSVGEVFDKPATLINYIVPNLFILAGTILFFMVIAGGFSIVAGGGADSVEKGKNQITLAILGFIIMFAAYWIVQVVEFLTGVPIFSSSI